MAPATFASLEQLFEGIHASVQGQPLRPISSIATDSRLVQPGALFFCLRGERADGHTYVREALAAGAVAIVSDRAVDSGDAARVVVADPLAALSKVAATFYGDPSESLVLVGVTGTNGKTTTTYFIESIAREAGVPFGVAGTLGARFGEMMEPLTNTTPQAHELQRLLARFRDAGARGAVIEVSSHALELHRVDDVRFDVAVFTNLTHDHLDFHRSFDAYRAAKRKLFGSALGKGGAPPVAVLNADDEEGRALERIVRADRHARCLTYGVENEAAMLRATDLQMDAAGTKFWVRQFRPAPFFIRLPGAFNVANAMAALAAGVALDFDSEAIASGLEAVAEVPGRMVSLPADGVGVFIDYAHTPDGMEQLLRTVRALTSGRLYCIFGCGGDRDATKRPAMGRIAQELADHVIVTTDNPRHEDPETIVHDILAGMEEAEARHEVILDRAQAIENAIGRAAAGDSVVIAGKGHEDYQLVQDERRPFSDAQVARAALGRRTAVR